MQRAFGYTRVSSAGQAAQDRDGITRQKEAIRKYAAAHGYRIVQWFCDTVSGTKDLENRPALQQLIAALHSNGTTTVLIEKLDRLARDLMIQESILADYKRNEFTIISTAEPDLCSADPTRILVRQILGAFSEYERRMIVQKLRGARLRAAAKNPQYKEGRKAFGDRPGEHETIGRALELRASGMSLAKIAQQLTEEGRRTRDGGQYLREISRTTSALVSARGIVPPCVAECSS